MPKKGTSPEQGRQGGLLQHPAPCGQPVPAAPARWEGEPGADIIPAPEECFAVLYPLTKIIQALGYRPNHRRITAKKASRSSREIANPLTVFPDQHNYSFKSTEQIFLFSPSSFSLWPHSDGKRHVCAWSGRGDGGLRAAPHSRHPWKWGGGQPRGAYQDELLLKAVWNCARMEGSRGPNPAPKLHSTPLLQSGVGAAGDTSSGGREQLESLRHPKS